MDSGFPYGDIIVIAAIAAFILLRYRAMLGEQRGRDESFSPIAQELERVIQLPASRLQPEKAPADDFSKNYGSLAEALVAMRGVDRDFAPDEFMHGARTAYEMVITAYSKRDRDTLKMLLSPALFQQFDTGIREEEAAKRFTDTTLVAISKATMAEAKLVGNQATIVVEFVSEQVHLVRDAEGTILEGNASQQNVVEDRWVFTRDLKNASPNWTIVEM